MSKRNYRTYTKEFKLEALKLLETSGKSAGQIERELGIISGLLVNWRDRCQTVQKACKKCNSSQATWRLQSGRSRG